MNYELLVAAMEKNDFVLAANIALDLVSTDYRAQAILGQILLFGLAGERNVKLAVYWLTCAANAGHPIAHDNLYQIYKFGDEGIEIHPENAKFHRKKSVELGFDCDSDPIV